MLLRVHIFTSCSQFYDVQVYTACVLLFSDISSSVKVWNNNCCHLLLLVRKAAEQHRIIDLVTDYDWEKNTQV